MIDAGPPPSQRIVKRWKELGALQGPSWGSYISDHLRVEALVRWRHHVRGVVLDLGCGGRPYERLLGGDGTRWVGIDLPAWAETHARADVFADFAVSVPFADCSVDTVLSTQVLEHVADPELLLRESTRVLRPGGWLVLTAPQTNHVHGAPHDYFRFTCHGLEELARRVGLEVQAIEPMGGAIAAVAQQVVWHLSPLSRLPRFGGHVEKAIAAVVQVSALRLDRLARRHGDGAAQTTIGYVLVASRPRERSADSAQE